MISPVLSHDLGSLPDDFIRSVKDALEHLYDLPHLQNHPLVSQLNLHSGQNLRKAVVAAVEVLSPGESVPFLAPHARLYNVLLLHYIEKVTLQEVAYQLSISTRQVTRNLRQGEESVAAVLWSRIQTAADRGDPDRHRGENASPELPEGELNAAVLSSLQAEVARLSKHSRPVDVVQLLQRAIATVKAFAEQRSIQLRVWLPDNTIMLPVDPVLAEQVLTSVISRAVSQSQPGEISFRFSMPEGRVLLRILYMAVSQDQEPVPVTNQAAEKLAEQIGWSFYLDKQQHEHSLVVSMSSRCPTILLVDDNEGLVGLLERYLTQEACRVVAASCGSEGLRLAEEITPDAVVLDVMMPEMPGWEVLQRLRANPKTANIPVIICSVMNEPVLAQALGASYFLPKPVRQDDVLAALNKLGIV